MTALGTVARVTRLLTIFAEAQSDLSIKDVSALIDLPASTVHRLLKLLSDDGIITVNPTTHRYSCGHEFARIASLVASKTSIVDIARPFMEAVVAQCKETCVFIRYVRATGKMSVAAVVSSPNPLRYEMEMYTPKPVLWGATGNAILAFLPRDEQLSLYAIGKAERSPVTGEELPEQGNFLESLDLIKARGYAISHGKTIAGAVGMGAPVFDGSGGVVGSLCVTLPELRSSREVENAIVEALKPKARELSTALGFRGINS
ncbi:IclR family transcriptional regulator [Agrobacterium rhizogenes]|uniref:IclR family transcriptional regulator n=1 Tax=Rhizobium rhizogenes TaxID=359 RepID=UPI0015738BB3|nr:IclR family transcriptional regulator [Rhizobium rhizogenes]NTH16739.1 IclR family transcriptional regulator [Rhizobium rhizogenes]